MSTITKSSGSTANSNYIPAGIYILKVTAVDGKDSAAGQPMFAIDSVLLTKDGSDVVNDGFVIGGRQVKRQYFSFSERAAAITTDRLAKMGVSQEALDELTDTSDKEWIDANLIDRCYQAVVGCEERYRASDLKGYTKEGLDAANKKNPNRKLEFILGPDGQPIRTGLDYVVVDIVGAATPDGQPF